MAIATTTAILLARPSWHGEPQPRRDHDGLQGRPSWFPGETTTVSIGDRRDFLHTTTVSNLPAILDARLWRDGVADCEMWDGHRHGF
ncbi:hypothetical protein TIFTF001_049634 [Ficus carica]|uniref:Uncharacterized protein n=1 Tax=Ficus carica TaxID=3494 RepID=A0AA87Z5T9_FICCA|nr:hypothetical protein TIFTF001_049634 [Ficus carica]